MVNEGFEESVGEVDFGRFIHILKRGGFSHGVFSVFAIFKAYKYSGG